MKEEEKIQGEMIGETLLYHRTALKMTLRDVEKATGISNSYISQIERGLRGVPNFITLSKLAKTYGTSYLDILQSTFLSAAIRKERMKSYSPDAQYIASEYEKLSEINQKTLSQFLQYLIQQEKNQES